MQTQIQTAGDDTERASYKDLGLELRSEELVELLVADLSVARAFYAGIPIARLLARIRLASDERDLLPSAKMAPASWDALLRKLLESGPAHDRVKRAVARNSRAASDEGPLTAGDSVIAVLVFALSASADADASLAEIFGERSAATCDSAVARACAAYEPRLLGSLDLRGVSFEACVRLATRASAGPWPLEHVLKAARQLRISDLALRLLRTSSATLLPLEVDPEVPLAMRRMVLLERAELDGLVARDPHELATAITRMERAQGTVAHLDRLLADLTKLLALSGALVLTTLHPGLPLEEAEPASLPSERPISWMPSSWTSPDAAAQLARALERGVATLPRLRAVVQRGGEPALDAIGAEMLFISEHPFASATFAEVLARTGRARDIMRLVTYFAVAPDPAAVAHVLGLCTSPVLPSVLKAWLTSMLPSDGALAPHGDNPATSSAARINAYVAALRPYPVLYGAVRPLLARVTDAPAPLGG